MPRWSGGWGVQFIHEYRFERAMLDGRRIVGEDLDESMHLLHVEGVYTWHKSVRATLKLPVVLAAERIVLDDDGTRRTETGAGLGDATLTVPLKRYFNLDGRSGSYTFAPHVRIPLGPEADYNPERSGWGFGAAVGFETETYRYHFGTSASALRRIDAPDRFDYALGAGLNVHGFGSSGHVKLKTHTRFETDGSTTVAIGPTVYWKFTDLVHGQFEWKHDVYDRQDTPDHGDGDAFRVGVGFVF